MTKPPEIRAPGLSGSRSRGIFSADFSRPTPSTDGFVANYLMVIGNYRNTFNAISVKKGNTEKTAVIN